ncbi:MAG: ATP-binding protein [Pseudomonadota bacterium]
MTGNGSVASWNAVTPGHRNTLKDDHALQSLEDASRALDSSYQQLQQHLNVLNQELAESRTALKRELADKERLLAHLSSLLAALPGGVLILNSDEEITATNAAAGQLLGEHLLGESWSRVAEQLVANQSQVDSERHLSVTRQPLSDDGLEHVVLITDTTELRNLQRQLSNAERLAAMGEMAASLAHQIRTPLASTSLYLAQLGRDDLCSADRVHICERLSNRLQHMDALIDSMLGFVRERPVPLSAIDLSGLLRSFHQLLHTRLPDGTQLILDATEERIDIIAHNDDLLAALTNLVMNAVEHGGKTIAVDMRCDQDWAEIRVKDNGVGIPRENMEKIFDPFFTTRQSGTGLGLAVVARTIEIHRGKISVSNRPSGGTEFVLKLPRIQAADNHDKRG